MIGLALKLDAFVEDFEGDRVDLFFDEIDKTIADLYREAINKTQNVSHAETVVKGWDPAIKSKVEGKIGFDASSAVRLDVTYVGTISVAGKNDALVLATDIVANALNNHLSNLPVGAPLNAPSSIQGWILQDRVYGVRDNAIEDII